LIVLSGAEAITIFGFSSSAQYGAKLCLKTLNAKPFDMVDLNLLEFLRFMQAL
jgi:hypothetical protein